MNTIVSKVLSVTAALALALLVSGCVIYPAGPFHPYHWWGHR
jgi:hypothetical protein